MVRCEAEVQIAKPVADVFAVVDDESKFPLWMGLCADCSRGSSGAKATGMPLHFSQRQGDTVGELDGELTAYEPGKLIAMKFEDASSEVIIELSLDAKGEATSVKLGSGMQPKSFFGKLTAGFGKGGMQKQAEKDLGKLKKLLEQG